MAIQKLDKFDSTEASIYHVEKLYEKVNQLVDAVNEIMTWRFETDEDSDWYDDPKHREQPADPYAEQRRWIGCLCRFGSGVTPVYGILGGILPDRDLPYYKKDTDTYWKYCEPVKPDSEIIYHGE